MEKQYYTIKEFAEINNITPDTVRQRIYRGTTKAEKFGKFWLIPVTETLTDNRHRKPSEFCYLPMDVNKKEEMIIRSNICHELKRLGEEGFLRKHFEEQTVQKLFRERRFFKCLYLMATLEHEFKKFTPAENPEYIKYKKYKFAAPVFPEGILVLSAITENKNYKKEALRDCYPEFLSKNIVEGDIYDAV